MSNTWPLGIQQKLNTASFQKNFGSTSVRSEMDIGPEKVRARFTDAVDTYSCSIFLSYSEYATFETFFKVQLGNGILPFDFTEPFTLTTEQFRFVEPPRITPLGGLEFVVSMNWEKLP